MLHVGNVRSGLNGFHECFNITLFQMVLHNFLSVEPASLRQSDPTCRLRIVAVVSLYSGRKATASGKCDDDSHPLGGRKCIRPLTELAHDWPYLLRFSYTSYRHTLGCPEPERTTQIINEPFGPLTTVIALALIGCLRKCSCQVRRLELA